MALKASRLYGKGNVQAATRLAEQAIEINPGCHVAYLTLIPGLINQSHYEKAEKIMKEGLHIFPDDNQFNILMAQILAQRGESIDEVVVYVKAYFRSRSGKGEMPLIMKVLFRLLNRGKQLDVTMKEVDQYSSKTDKWALEVLKRFESGHGSADITN